MHKLYFGGSKSFIDEQDKKVVLDYYLMETGQQAAREELQVFGLKIVKKLEIKGMRLYEEESVEKLAYSKHYVIKMLEKLMDNLVTPMCMIEVLDDLMSEELMN